MTIWVLVGEDGKDIATFGDPDKAQRAQAEHGGLIIQRMGNFEQMYGTSNDQQEEQ